MDLIKMKKTIMIIMALLMVGSVAAWNTNPTYNPFEIIWNEIVDISARIVEINDTMTRAWVDNGNDVLTDKDVEITGSFTYDGEEQTTIINSKQGLYRSRGLVAIVNGSSISQNEGLFGYASGAANTNRGIYAAAEGGNTAVGGAFIGILGSYNIGVWGEGSTYGVVSQGDLVVSGDIIQTNDFF
jgi:hypothetical protein